jgi:hypothetical protein
MNIDNGKSIENFDDIPEFYNEIINCWVEFGGGQTKTPTNCSHTTCCYQASFYKLNFYY